MLHPPPRPGRDAGADRRSSRQCCRLGASELGEDLEDLPNSEVRNSETFGVLKVTLYANSYAWQFIPIAGQTFTDEGTGSCH